jgi:site-specific DNA recombinase
MPSPSFPYKHEDHPGEQPAIIDHETWVRVQAILERNGRTGGALVRNQFGFTLKGLIHCASCGCAMTPSHSLQKKTRRYRYYVCLKATKYGWNTCPSPSVPAGQIEEFIAAQIREVGNDPGLQRETLRQLREQEREQLAHLDGARGSGSVGSGSGSNGTSSGSGSGSSIGPV